MMRIHEGHFYSAVYRPVGKCIYCGSNGDARGLRSEHIFPFFLGGNLELPAASCADCEKITSFIEGHCANRIFLGFRTHKKMQTRRPKNRPTHFALQFLGPDGWRSRDIPSDEAPFFLPLPYFDQPGVLIGDDARTAIQPLSQTLITTADFRERAQKFIEPGETDCRITVPTFDPAIFARFIAKIALAGAVAMLNYDSAKSPLGQIVLGIDSRIGQLVGCEPKETSGIQYVETPPVVGKDIHEIGFAQWADGTSTRQVLTAHIEFILGHLTGLRYVAVIGPAMPNPVENYIQAPVRSS